MRPSHPAIAAFTIALLFSVGAVATSALAAPPSAAGQRSPAARTAPSRQPPPQQARPRVAPTRRRPATKTYHCPLCGTAAHAIGHDGRPSPRRYSDLEMPTRAYTNLVVACSKCGYAAWSQDFESPVSAAAQHYTQRYLGRTAKRAAQTPLLAYQHHMNLLHVRRASLHEQIGAALFYTYVLKRSRPYGGMDPKLERRVQKARKRALALLTLGLKKSPPSDPRTRLEWQYLRGELMRLTGDARGALADLQQVCWARKQAGYTIGRLACQMADRAKRGESWEDYRDGVTDVAEIATAEKRAKALAAKTAAEAKARAKAKAEAEKVAAKQAEAKRKAAPATSPKTAGAAPPAKPGPAAAADPYAPAPPPVVK